MEKRASKSVLVRLDEEIYNELWHKAEAFCPSGPGRSGGIPYYLKMLVYQDLKKPLPEPRASYVSPRKLGQWFWIVGVQTGAVLRIGLDPRVGSWILRVPPHLPRGVPGAKRLAAEPTSGSVAYGNRPYEWVPGASLRYAGSPRAAFHRALDAAEDTIGEICIIFLDLGDGDGDSLQEVGRVEAVMRAVELVDEKTTEKLLFWFYSSTDRVSTGADRADALFAQLESRGMKPEAHDYGEPMFVPRPDIRKRYDFTVCEAMTTTALEKAVHVLGDLRLNSKYGEVLYVPGLSQRLVQRAARGLERVHLVDTSDLLVDFLTSGWITEE